MKIILSKKSKLNLSAGLDYRLVDLALTASREEFLFDWGVFETKRTLEQQKENLKNGVSKTLNSNHIPNSKGIVNAMDIVPWIDGRYTWDNKTAFQNIIMKFKKLAEAMYPYTFTFGYDWGWDAPHIEIKREKQL